jgi:hypothetical protein
MINALKTPEKSTLESCRSSSAKKLIKGGATITNEDAN